MTARFTRRYAVIALVALTSLTGIAAAGEDAIGRTGRIAWRGTSQCARPASGIPDDRQFEKLLK
ncbi:MAG: hypothetical protein ACKV0T_16540 [Planctomycetales bacterium]